MKKSYCLFLVFLAIATTSLAQDYEVRSIEHLPLDMTAKINNLTERPNGGQYCAVLRIATQNILAESRNDFQFRPDMGSFLRERRNEGGEILLWVSPGINYLTIKHKDLGNTLIFIPELLHGEVESLNTYRILIVGTKELPQPETKRFGSCHIVFRPSPEDAVIYLNGDSIGVGNHTIPTIAGTYHWSMEHPLYHTEEGTIELAKGKTDTVDVALSPAYGYLKIIDDYGLDSEMKVYLNDEYVGIVPYESEKMASGLYDVTFEKQDTLFAKGQIEVKDNLISINGMNDLFKHYYYNRPHNNDTSSFNRTVSGILASEDLDNNDYIPNPSLDNIIDSVSCIVPTKYVPITGRITINSIPESAVTIDGMDFGYTPITIDTLCVGMHDLELTSNGCSPLIQRVSVKEGEETTYNLQLPRECMLTINSDEDGDLIQIDHEYLGRTPLTTMLPFGVHTILLTRVGKYQQMKTIELTPEEPELTVHFSFGQVVFIEAESKKNRVYVDGEYQAKTPTGLFIPNGKHSIRVERGWKAGAQEVTIKESDPIDRLFITSRFETPKGFLANGAFFMTGNVAFMKTAQPVYGVNIGDICNRGTVGWYFSFYANDSFINQMLNRDRTLFDAEQTNSGGYLNHTLPTYTDETSDIRASALMGVALKVSGPVYLRIGTGVGIRYFGRKTTDDKWVADGPISWKNMETSLGLQCNIYNFVINADALIPSEVFTTETSLVEFRAGIGFALRHKKSKRFQ